MNVVTLGAFTELDFRIITDVLMLLSALGVAVLMLLAWREQSNQVARKRAVRVELLPSRPATRLAQTGASLHPWEFPCARHGATRAPPPHHPPVRQSDPLQTSSGVAAPEGGSDLAG